MSRALLVCCLIAAVAMATRAAPQNRFESVDVDSVISNERLLKSYIRCMLDNNDSKCTSEGKDLKKSLPKLVETGCGECSPKQLDNSVKVLKHLTEHFPQDWARLKAKFDPDGKYARQHSETWKQRGVTF